MALSSGRRVALFCLDVSSDDFFRRSDFLSFNYAARRIQAALLDDPHLDDAEVRLFDLRTATPEDVSELAIRFEADVVGFSTYAWSFSTFAQAARLIKQQRPSCVVVFGGPAAREAMFQLPCYGDVAESVDCLVTRSGEYPMRSIVRLSERTPERLSEIAGVTVRTSNGWTANPQMPPDVPLDALPSPYQMDLVPPGVTAYLETFRGCPMSCSFCQWGDDDTKGIGSAAHIARELAAFERIRANGVYLVDAGLNLNRKAFLNLVAAEAEIGFFAHNNLTCEIYPALIRDEHLQFLSRTKVLRAGVGVQSLDKDTLKRVQRPFDEKKFDRNVRALSEIAPCTYELVLGLPGDSPEGFWRTIERLTSYRGSIMVHYALVLPDALMTRAHPQADIKFDPRTLKMISCWGWTEDALRSTSERLMRLVDEVGGSFNDHHWHFNLSDPERPATAGQASSPPASVDEALLPLLASSVADATAGAWRMVQARREGDAVILSIATPEGEMSLDVRRVDPRERSYRVRDGLAFSYRSNGSQILGERMLELLDATVEALASQPHAADRSVAHSVLDAGRATLGSRPG